MPKGDCRSSLRAFQSLSAGAHGSDIAHRTSRKRDGVIATAAGDEHRAVAQRHRDMAMALAQDCGGDVHRVWHGDATLPEGLDLIALPGGFSYGDYLRSGAMAAGRETAVPGLSSVTRERAPVRATVSPIRASEQT